MFYYLIIKNHLRNITKHTDLRGVGASAFFQESNRYIGIHVVTHKRKVCVSVTNFSTLCIL